MKESLSKIIIISVLMSLFIPVAALAQTGPIECCKMRRAVTIDGVIAAKDTVVGEGKVGESCSMGKSTAVLTAPSPTTKWGLFCLINTINAVIDWIFIVLISVVMIFVAIGAFNILTSAGSPDKVASGRNYILYAAIGLLVALLARAVPAIVISVIGN